MNEPIRLARLRQEHARAAALIADIEQQRGLASRRDNGHSVICVCPDCYALDQPMRAATARLIFRMRTVPVERLWDETEKVS